MRPQAQEVRNDLEQNMPPSSTRTTGYLYR
jgi:hypothetical protein